MPTLSSNRLESMASAVFVAAGASPDTAHRVAKALVASDLAGHPSHGLLRLPQYVEAIRSGGLVPNAEPTVVVDDGCIAAVDGHWGFGQIAAEMAADLAAAKAERHGLACVALRRANHVGRLSDYGCMVAERGHAALVFVNGHGRSELVAPFGGAARRLATNPVCIAVPDGDGSPVVFDAATSIIAEGKVRLARNRGERLPPDCVIDAEGRATTEPQDLYGPPPGALLLMGGPVEYKGFGLSLMTDILAGALTGAGCSGSGDRGGNAMLMLAINVSRLIAPEAFREHVRALCAHVRSAPLREGAERILMPGEPEQQSRARLLAEGVAVDEATWRQIVDAGRSVGVNAEALAAGPDA